MKRQKKYEIIRNFLIFGKVEICVFNEKFTRNFMLFSFFFRSFFWRYHKSAWNEKFCFNFLHRNGLVQSGRSKKSLELEKNHSC